MEDNIIRYFSRIQEGGAINSAGLAQQDCVSIIYIFRYLDDENFKAITFETLDDFTILLKNKEIGIQVKINLLSIKFVRELLEKYDCIDGRTFVGNGFDDEFRNLYLKLLQYRNAIDIRQNNNETLLKEIKELCDKNKIDFDKIIKIQFDSVDNMCSVNLAKYSITEWAEKKHLFVNTFGILSELQTIVSLGLREKRGFLTKQDILNIVQKHRNSRIADNYTENIKEMDIKHIIQSLEKIILEQPLISNDLQIVKYEIENKMYVEAFNHILNLRSFLMKSIEEIYIWLLFKNEDYKAIVEINKKDSDFEKILLSKALKYMYRYDEAIDNLNEIENDENSFEKNFLLAQCYKNKGEKEKSKLYYESCLKLNQYKELVYFELGMMNEYSEECIDYMNKALNVNNKFYFALLEKGRNLRYFGKFKKAIKCFEKYMDMSKDYVNSDVLLEMTMSYYNSGEKNNTFMSRWVDRFINFDVHEPIDDGKTIPVIDIGYEYSNIILLVVNKDYIEVKINNENIMKVQYKIHSISAIGLYVSPTNKMFAKISSVDEEDEEEVDLEASLPTLFKIYDSEEEYLKSKNEILLQNVLHLNHKWDGYEEYIVHNKDIEVNITKFINSLNASIQIGDYVIDENIPNISEGFHGFRSKLQGNLMFDEAAIVLTSQKEICQITFNKNRIKIFDKMLI
ncbi:hypothetical protein [Clostridium sp. CH2]|uniref:tetratricopeptide repeat protein n=1 Tax=Clostridium sp. CH2 TaxID=2949990 RepID=UPI002079B9CA